MISLTHQYPSGTVAYANFTDQGDGQGTFAWTPDSYQVGDHFVYFTATSGELSDSELVTITVNNVAVPPVLASIGDKLINVGYPLTFSVTATAGAAAQISLAHQFSSGTVTNASFVDHGNGTGSFAWTPSVDYVGDHFVQANVPCPSP